MPTSIRVQPLAEFGHLNEAVALGKTIWGYSDLDIESPALLVIASRFVGQVIGAFDEKKLVGIALAFCAIAGSEMRLHSHRVGVLPEYQNRGIGRMLKLAQRQDAIGRGIRVIQWTFDPLQQRNAYFNIEKLGGISRQYISNLYGITSSPLHGGLPTDRLLIEWELESPRVLRILKGDKPAHLGQIERIPVPDSATNRNAASQRQLREQFLQMLSAGYVVTGFERNADGAFYLLERQ